MIYLEWMTMRERPILENREKIWNLFEDRWWSFFAKKLDVWQGPKEASDTCSKSALKQYIYMLHILQVKYNDVNVSLLLTLNIQLLAKSYLLNQLILRRKYFKKNQKKNFTSSTWAVFPFWYMYPCTFMFCNCFSTEDRSQIIILGFFKETKCEKSKLLCINSFVDNQTKQASTCKRNSKNWCHLRD